MIFASPFAFLFISKENPEASNEKKIFLAKLKVFALRLLLIVSQAFPFVVFTFHEHELRKLQIVNCGGAVKIRKLSVKTSARRQDKLRSLL